MNYIIVISELHQLPPPKRWSMLVAPLAEELDNSGLGRIVDLDSLRREANELGRIEAEELAVELVDLGYGREVVKGVVSAAGLKPCNPVTPKRWLDFHCEDYFSEGWSEHGHFDEPSQTWVIVPLTEAYEDTDIEFLVVGRSGWGGIDFGYRKGQAGLWCYYPIDREFKFMAGTVAELVDGWCSGRLSV
jgi:hypothetical protein